MPAGAPATLPLLHRFLGIGLVMVATSLLALKSLGIAPALPPNPLLAYALSGIGIALATVALVVFKPRVPERPATQPVEEYWTTPDVGTKVLPVWFLLEGGGTLAVVAYFLTGGPVAAAAAGVLIAAFWWCGPDVFAKP